MAKKVSTSNSKKNDYTFKKVAENLYRLNQTGGYYALVKRGGKQIRRSLKTKDRALAKRRLNDFKKQIKRLTSTSDIPKSTFSEFAEHWLKAAEVNLKQKTVDRLESCIKALKPYVGKLPLRSITNRDCENWRNDRAGGDSFELIEPIISALIMTQPDTIQTMSA